MGEYESEYGYEDYGTDPGYDPDAIAQQAANDVANAVAPILQQQQNAIAQLTAIGQMQAQKYALEHNDEEQRNAQEAQRIARERVGPGFWDANKDQLADYLDAHEELLPESRLGSAEAIADGLVTAARLYQQDAEKEAAAANRRLQDKHLAEMKGALNRSSYEHMVREVQG